MNCRNVWNRDFLAQHLPRTWLLGEYKKKREEMLLLQELALLPATQPHAERLLTIKRLNKILEDIGNETVGHIKRRAHRELNIAMPEYKAINKEYNAKIAAKRLELAERIELARKNHDFKEYILIRKELGKHANTLLPLRQQRLAAKKKMQIAQDMLRRALKWEINPLVGTIKQVEQKRLAKEALVRVAVEMGADGRGELIPEKSIERRQFIRKCPANGCEGFLSTAWKCGVCEIWVCPECREIKGNSRDTIHNCDADILKTIKAMAEDTKACPSCSALITRISGCPQMWCTECHTTFDWNTLRIDSSGNVHNPHYFEWQRRMGNNGQRIVGAACGGIPNVQLLWSHCTVNLPSVQPYSLEYACRIAVEIQRMILRRRPMALDNEDLRIKLLMGDIDRSNLAKEIQKRDKAGMKLNDVRMIAETFVAGIIDLGNMFLETKNVIEANKLLTAAEELRNHCNSAFETTARSYNNVTPRITEKWLLIDMGYEKDSKKKMAEIDEAGGIYTWRRQKRQNKT